MIRPRPVSSLPRDRVSLGCPQLDAFLGGGLPVGSLTELVGEPGASKTQVCLQAMLTATLPCTASGMGGSAVYIYTEGEPAMKRLRELASVYRVRTFNSAGCAGGDGAAAAAAAGPEASDPTAHVFVEKGVHDGHELLARLRRLRSLLAAQARSQRPVRLLVVDSVGHVLRELGGAAGAVAGTAQLAGRTELLFRLSAMLR